MKIGILGGSFNPIHNGHLNLAIAARDEYSLDRVLIMPNSDTYYKKDAEISDADRMNMIQLSIRGQKKLYLSDIEVKRGGITYTIDTIRFLKENDAKNNNQNDYFFIVGGDSLHNLYYWREIDELFRNMTFLAAVRDDIDEEEMLRIREEYLKTYPYAKIDFLHTGMNPVSSSEIRKKITEGEDVQKLLPESVKKYIDIRKLYRA
ncbi:nicotinate-nucleotide adenylyltransferase [Eubacterium ruminantium]|nr:nicotinate-nucleotide adenylyltransferase [Eubacterium ruminantium]